MRKSTAVSLLLGSLFVTACQGQGGRNLGGGGRYCDEGEAEKLFNVPKNAVLLNETVTGVEELPIGEYTLETADYLYVKKIDPENSSRWVMLGVQEKANGAGDYNTYRSCARGITKTDTSFSSEVPGIKNMVIGEGRKVDYEPSLWGFSYNHEKLMLEPPFCGDGQATCDGSEKTSFSGKLEPGSFADYKEVLTSFADQFRVIELATTKNNPNQRFMVAAKTEYEEAGIKYYQVLRLIFTYQAPEMQGQAVGQTGGETKPITE